MTQTAPPPDDTDDLTQELIVALEYAEGTIAHLVALLQRAGLYDERLADDVIKEQS